MKHFVFLSFLLLTIWAYSPSLAHAPKHDQLGYLAEMAQRHTVWDKTIGAYSLNRDREFMGATNNFLFRPLLNIWLGIQAVLFGYNFTLWQAMALALHLLTGFLLYRLLDAIRSGMSAAAVAGFFLLMLAGLPMVIWHNVSGYLIFCSLLLAALRLLFLYSRGPLKVSHAWGAAGLLFFSSCFFEVGCIFLFCVAGYMFCVHRQKKIWGVFLVAGCVYLLWNGLDLLSRHTIADPEAGRIINAVLLLKTLWNFLIALKWFLFSGLFLKAGDIISVERVVLSLHTTSPVWPFMSAGPHLVRGILAVLLTGIMIWLSFYRQPKRGNAFFLLLLTMIAAQIFCVCVGRVNTRGALTGLFFNAYYIYFFWVLFLPAVYLLIDLRPFSARRDVMLLRMAAYTLCGAFIFINALSVFNVNRMVAGVDQSRRSFLDATTNFVNMHRSEKDFSFFIPHTCPGNYAGKWLHKGGDPLSRRWTLAEALYPQYYRKTSFKYLLSCTEPKGF